MQKFKGCFLLLVTVLSTGLILTAQNNTSEIELSSADRNLIIQRVLKSLENHYVSREMVFTVAKTIRERNKKGVYSKITSGAAFSDTLTRHLRETSKDEHLGLIFRRDSLSTEQAKQPTSEETERFRRYAASQNYGFEKLERLPGNIGYMELNGFIRPDWGAETAIAALNFLANTDALIVDLRYNGGGEPGLVQLISSFFFEKPTHLNTIFWREGMRAEQHGTMPYVPGKRYLNKPIYILTSKNTFSAAEDFAYSLQAQKRATIIGERTRGGANAGRTFPIHRHFEIYIPVGKAVNPITGKNWGGGIIPDIRTEAKRALRNAHKEALQRLIEQADSQKKKQQLQDVLKEISM